MGVHSAQELKRIRRSRRHPRPTQFDYVHIRRLVSDLEITLRRVAGAHDRVLDIYCGWRPYDDLLPYGPDIVGLDVTGNPYGVADVVSDEFLPFPDASFDLAMCIQAFDTSRTSVGGRRNPADSPPRRFAHPHNPSRLGVRPTDAGPPLSGPDLAALFDGWRDVEVIESGGRAVASGNSDGLARGHRRRRGAATGLACLLRPVVAGVYGVVNLVGLALDAGEQRYARGPNTLPMNLLLCARSPETPELP